MRESYIQGFLSRAGADVSPLLLRAAELGGGLASWRRVEREFNLSLVDEVARDLFLIDPLPWRVFDVGLDRRVLVDEFLRSSLDRGSSK